MASSSSSSSRRSNLPTNTTNTNTTNTTNTNTTNTTTNSTRGGSGPPSIGRMLALVLGIAEYAPLHPLASCTTDAQQVAGHLRRLGWQVTACGLDLDGAALVEHIEGFVEQCKEQKAGATFFYFSGHGMEYRGDGQLYLLARDFKGEAASSGKELTHPGWQRELRRASYSLRDVMDLLADSSRCPHNIMVLDCCRTVAGKGTANQQLGSFVQYPGGEDAEFLILYAVRTDREAKAAGAGQLSPFTKSVVQELFPPPPSQQRSVFDALTAAQERIKRGQELGRERQPELVTSLASPFQRFGIDGAAVCSPTAAIAQNTVGGLPLQLPNYLVGVEQQAAEVLDKLQLGSGGTKRVVLLHGIGGIGKTELANKVYEAVRQQGKFECVVLKLGQRAGDAEVCAQQASCAGQLGAAVPETGDVRAGAAALARALQACAEPVFVRVDDVWHPHQLPLVLQLEHMPAGSRVVVTSRKADAACSLGHVVGCSVVQHAVNEMSKEDAKKLLAYHVCGRLDGDLAATLGRHAGKVDEVLRVLGGLPLGIEVVGMRLRDRPAAAVHIAAQLCSLSDAGDEYIRLNNVLHGSIDGLGRDLLEAFVAVAFLRGLPWDGVWGCLGWRLEDLVSRGLVKQRQQPGWLGDRGRVRYVVWMHDLVAACAEGKYGGRYLTDAQPSMHAGAELCWGVRMTCNNRHVLGCLQAMVHLRYLVVEGSAIDMNVCLQTNPVMTFIRILECCCRSLPDGVLAMSDLRALDLCTAIAKLPEGISGLSSLHTLSLSGCQVLGSLPEGICGLCSLHTLDLSRCEVLASLPEGVSGLFSLHTLDLSGCKMLASLPEGISGLSSMHTLDLSRCQSLLSLPQAISCLSSLHTLHLSRCRALASLPEAISCLSSLHTLHLHLCEVMLSLPEGISCLSSLHTLDLSECKLLASLPEGVRCLSSLHTLDLSKVCKVLASLPEGISSMLSMHTLNLSECQALASLPEGISSMASLHTLDLSECRALGSLPEGVSGLCSLHTLNLSKCGVLASLPEGISGLSNLHILNLGNCKSLASLPEGMSQLSSLHTLNLSWCDALASLPEGLSQLSSLHCLNLSCCSWLVSLPERVSSLSSLRTLCLIGCRALARLPQGISGLSNLHTLDLSGCLVLASLPEAISGLSSLHTLNLSNCKALTSLPKGISGLCTLHTLNLSWCTALARLPGGLNCLSSLHTLNLNNCLALASLHEGVSSLRNLHTLCLIGCQALASLPQGMRSLSSLHTLDLSRSATLASLPEGISGLCSLHILNLSDCKALASLPEGVSNLSSLYTLNLSGCEALAGLPQGISGLSSLHTLSLSWCKALASLPEGMSVLSSLRVMDLRRCTALTRLPKGLSSLSSLQTFPAWPCTSCA